MAAIGLKARFSSTKAIWGCTRLPVIWVAIAFAFFLSHPTTALALPPTAPINLTSIPSGWSTQNDFAVNWSNPAHNQPIIKARYKIGSAPENNLDGTEVFPILSDPPQISGLEVEGAGEYTIWVWLEDTESETSYENASTTKLKYDPDAPGEAKPEEKDGWIGYEDLPYLQIWAAPDPLPLSGLKGYATAIVKDGEDPEPGDEITDLPTLDTSKYLPDLDDGIYIFSAKAFSYANKAGPVSTAKVKIDATEPETQVTGEPESEWSKSPFTVSLTPKDVTSGPKSVTYSFDGGAEKTESAPQIPFATEGPHRLTYYATDHAGNNEDENVLELGVDQTPPTTAFENTLNRNAPVYIEAEAKDTPSGISDGVISYRKRGSDDSYKPLITKYEKGKLTARFPDSQVKKGVYELIAEVQDQAGNQATTDKRKSGANMLVRAPIRKSYRVRAGFVPMRYAGKKGVNALGRAFGSKKKLKLRKSRSARVARKIAIAGQIKVPQLKGKKLSTFSNGKVQILTRKDQSGSKWRPLKKRGVQTASNGTFSITTRARISRLYSIKVRGNAKYRLTRKILRVKVPAKASIYARSHKLRKGRALHFSGRIFHSAADIPKPGKEFRLEYKRPASKHWLPAAVSRTNKNGSYKIRYRPPFKVKGKKLYFRIKVTKEADWPFTVGTSSTIKMRVVGK